MRKAKREGSPLYPKILFGFTDHPITVWAGVILLRLYFEWIKLREELNETLVNFSKRSNNQISSVEVMLSWYYGLALGAERFEHFTRYRRDRLLGELLGVQRFCSPDTLRRLFLRFSYRDVTEVSERLMRFSLMRMRPILMGHTVDLDSTVFCRYGEQEGSLKGYNPTKPGRRSHHPLVAFLAEGRRLLWASMRSGNSGSANGCVEFIKQAVTVLPQGHRIGLLRGRCGIFRETILGVSGEPRAALYYRGAVNGGGAQVGDPSGSVERVAGGGTGDRGGRSGGQSTELENSEAALCMLASGDFGAARGQRETINRLSGIYLSGAGHERAVCS